MKRFIIVIIVGLLVIPPVALAQSTNRAKVKASPVPQLCSNMALMCGNCYDGNSTVAEIQDLGIAKGFDSQMVMLFGQFCETCIAAKSQGWSRKFTLKYASDSCYKTFGK